MPEGKVGFRVLLFVYVAILIFFWGLSYTSWQMAMSQMEFSSMIGKPWSPAVIVRIGMAIMLTAVAVFLTAAPFAWKSKRKGKPKNIALHR